MPEGALTMLLRVSIKKSWHIKNTGSRCRGWGEVEVRVCRGYQMCGNHVSSRDQFMSLFLHNNQIKHSIMP